MRTPPWLNSHRTTSDFGRSWRHYRLDKKPGWPERALNRDPAINMAEVDAALAKPIPQHPKTTAFEPQVNMMTYKELGIFLSGVFRKVRVR